MIGNLSYTQARLSKFNRFIAQAGYKFEFPLSHWALHPQALYHINNQVRQAEGLLIASYKDLIWGGAAYRQSNTWSGSVGFKLHQRAKIGYAYELASPQLAFGATHELTLHWQFGRKRKINKPGNIQQKQMERKIKTHLAQKPKPKLELREPQTESATPPEPAVAEPATTERIEHVAGSDNPNDLSKGNYVVVGTFGSEANAQKWQQKLTQQGYTPQYGYSSARKFYYVYLAKPDALSDALQEAKQLQRNSSLKDAWVLVME